MKSLVLTFLTTLILSACQISKQTPAPVVIPTLAPTIAASIPTESATPLPQTEAPTATATEASTVTPENIDLKSIYEVNVEGDYMGTTISSSLITNEDAGLKKGDISKEGWKQYVFEMVYKVFAKTHPDITIEQYAQMVHEVQDPAIARNPLNIAIPIWANDLLDGIRYQNPDGSVNRLAQKKYLVVPWFSGSLPVEVDGVETRAVSDISVALVRAKGNDNVTMFVNNPFDFGIGTNLIGDRLLIFDGFVSSVGGSKDVASGIAYIPSWLIKNTGGSASGYGTLDTALTNLLIKLGFTVSR